MSLMFRFVFQRHCGQTHGEAVRVRGVGAPHRALWGGDGLQTALRARR